MARRTPEGGSLEVYLLPSVVGGGLGDLAEVHSAGRWLSSAGFPVRIFRRPGHPETAQGLGPFDWPPITPRALPAGTSPWGARGSGRARWRPWRTRTAGPRCST